RPKGPFPCACRRYLGVLLPRRGGHRSRSEPQALPLTAAGAGGIGLQGRQAPVPVHLRISWSSYVRSLSSPHASGVLALKFPCPAQYRSLLILPLVPVTVLGTHYDLTHGSLVSSEGPLSPESGRGQPGT